MEVEAEVYIYIPKIPLPLPFQKRYFIIRLFLEYNSTFYRKSVMLFNTVFDRTLA